jgi:hypothetical protein
VESGMRVYAAIRALASPPPGSREPGAGGVTLRTAEGHPISSFDGTYLSGGAAPPTTPNMRECATCGDLACLHREDGCHANESAAGCYVKCKRFVPPPTTPAPTGWPGMCNAPEPGLGYPCAHKPGHEKNGIPHATISGRQWPAAPAAAPAKEE